MAPPPIDAPLVVRGLSKSYRIGHVLQGRRPAPQDLDLDLLRGEILGYGESSDAGHVTGPSAEGQARAIARALQSGRLAPEAVGYVNAHGTATRSNDTTESAALRAALGEDVDRVPVGSSKSMAPPSPRAKELPRTRS